MTSERSKHRDFLSLIFISIIIIVIIIIIIIIIIKTCKCVVYPEVKRFKACANFLFYQLRPVKVMKAFAL